MEKITFDFYTLAEQEPKDHELVLLKYQTKNYGIRIIPAKTYAFKSVPCKFRRIRATTGAGGNYLDRDLILGWSPLK